MNDEDESGIEELFADHLNNKNKNGKLKVIEWGRRKRMERGRERKEMKKQREIRKYGEVDKWFEKHVNGNFMIYQI